MSRFSRSIAPAVFAIALASCGAGQPGASMLPAPASPSVPAVHGRTSLTIALPAIALANQPIDWVSKPNLLSAATRSLSGSLGSHKFGPIALSPAFAGCAAGSAGLSCTITLHASPGPRQTLRVSTYATKNGTGPALAFAVEGVNVAAKRSNFVSPAIYGLAASVAVRPIDRVVREGMWAAEPLIAYGIDAARQPIPSVTVFNRTGTAPVTNLEITLNGFANEHLDGNDAANACCGIITPVFAYDGLRTGTETFTARAPGYPAYSTVLQALPNATHVATLIAASSYSDSPNSVNFVSQFAQDAGGDVAPVRSFIPPTADNRPYGEDARGSFWIGNTHFSNRGAVLGTLDLPAHTSAAARDRAGNLYAVDTNPAHCAAYEYAAGDYGQAAPIREIDLPRCSTGEDVTVDRNGNFFVAIDDASATQTAEILEYGPAGNGRIAPIRRIVIPGAGANACASLDTDAAGNLYALCSAGDGYQLSFFAPGATTGRPLLSGIGVQTFAVDDAGGIYARVYSPPGPGTLQYFPPGARIPSRVIGGSSTQLYDAGSIAVPRS